MTKPSAVHISELAAAKFAAPQSDPASHLPRRRLLRRALQYLGSRRVFVFEAQPGQGKTTAAAQLLAAAEGLTVWYRLDSDDRCPNLILLAITCELVRQLPSLQLDELIQELALHQQAPEACRRLCNRLLAELGEQLGEHTAFICFDDIERVREQPHTLELLGFLARNALPNLKVVLIGRIIPPQISVDLPTDAALWNRNTELAFSEEEIRELYENVLQQRYPFRFARTLHLLTEGWVTGILHLLDAMSATAAHRPRTPIADWPPLRLARETLGEFFRQNVLGREPLHRSHLLASLAWLEPIQTSLVGAALELDNPGRPLRELSAANLFLRPHSGNPGRYDLHPLFRDFLREESPVILGGHGHLPILDRAADWAQQQGLIEEALRHALRAEAYARVDRLTREHPILLLTSSRTLNLTADSQPPSAERTATHPWYALLYAFALTETDPAAAIPLLERTATTFSTIGDQCGWLAATARQIEAHTLADGSATRMAPLKQQLNEVLNQRTMPLPPPLELLVTLALAMARLFLREGRTQPDAHADRALELAQHFNAVNQEVGLRLVRGFGYILQGDFAKAGVEMEQLRRQARHPRLHDINRLLIKALSSGLLISYGAHDSFERHASKLERRDYNGILHKSLAGPLLHRWRAEFALSRGDFSSMLSHVEAGLALGHAAFSPHLRSQLLQYRAYAHAVRGDAAKARFDAEEALQLRTQAGGSYFKIHCRILTGAAQALIGAPAAAEALLSEAIAIARDTDAPYPLAGAYLHRAWLRLQVDDHQGAAADTEALLGVMKTNEYSHCFGWTPTVARPVLEFAAARDIDRLHAIELAARQLCIAVTPEGQSRPLLQLRTLGGFEIWLRDSCLATSRDLTPRPQQYVATLAAAPGMELSREGLQEAIWPDGGQSSSKLYALRNRIKNVIATQHPQVDIESYFALRGSLARLEHVAVDAVRFQRLVREGIQHWRSNRHWHAGNAFYEADRLWKGGFFPTAPDTDLIRDFRAELDRLNHQRVLIWSEILIADGDLAEAIELLSNAFDADPTNNEIAGLLYRQFLLSGSPVAAEKVLRRHRSELQQEGYPPEEIDCILEEFAANAEFVNAGGTTS